MRHHSNIFEHYDDLRASYASLLANQKSDSRKYQCAVGIGIALLFAGAAFRQTDYVWAFAIFGVLALLQGLVLFIDMSNRNSLLHVIDFIEWREEHAKRMRVQEAAEMRLAQKQSEDHPRSTAAASRMAH